MAVKIPTELQIMELADEMGLDLTNEDIEKSLKIFEKGYKKFF